MAEEDDDQTMELTIEALTGTVYDLCVSPYETILGIKMKIQRLEGIPVYQQQLVYGDTELQDENCLAEHSIPSGAQLKLLIAMRGGPIHAQRVQLDLEDPTLLEIAEILDSQAGDKYTVVLVRNTEDRDSASFVHVQMLNDDGGRESVSCSPLQVSDSHQRMGVVTSKVTQMEHDITRDKMKDLMAKLRKGRGYRHHEGHAPSVMAATSKASPSQLPRKGTAKVLILESCASSQLLHTPAKGSPLPVSVSHANESRIAGAQRKLVFSGEHCSCCHHSSKRKSSRSLASKRTRSPEEETFTTSTCSGSRKDSTRLKDESKDEDAPGYSLRDWRRTSKRLKRNSYIESEPPPPPTMTTTKTTDADTVDGVRDLVAQVSKLALNPTSNDDLCTPNPATSSLVGGANVSMSTRRQRTGGGFLPHIPSGHKPISLTARVPSRNGRGSGHALPPLTVSTTHGSAAASLTQGKSSRKRNHCMQCGKKMGLATTYSCRCGGMFCALHRYAETHSCNFDYKAEGRRLIARDNPIVMAPKLPKI